MEYCLKVGMYKKEDIKEIVKARGISKMYVYNNLLQKYKVLDIILDVFSEK